MSPERVHVLVVDDDPDALEVTRAVLTQPGWRVSAAESVSEALEIARKDPPQCVVSDVMMPGEDGFSLLETLRAEQPAVPVILMTGYGGLDDAVRAVSGGAERYLSKPARPGALREAVKTALARALVAREAVPRINTEALPAEAVVGRSPAIVALYATIARAAVAVAPVLIRGETGTGKEWVARAIHRYGQRSRGPFVALNASALPEGTLESELFGHTRGSFTGATGARRGVFQQAHGGVLFLDEVGELPWRVQAELLRVLQEGELRPVGADEVVKVDVRVVCATHRDLGALVREGKFREDLFFRLRVIDIAVPPLRDRREDIPALAEHFLAHAPGVAVSVDGRPKRLSAKALECLAEREWPGNVRELQAAVFRAAALSAGVVIVPEDLPTGAESVTEVLPSESLSLSTVWEHVLPEGIPSLEEVEVSFVQAVVRFLGGNKTQAAESLGVDRKTIRRILARGGVVPPDDTEG